MPDILENLKRVRERIELAAARVQRSCDEITIIAVTKTHGPDVVRAAIEAGIEDIGENRVQEFLAKAPSVDLPCRWHLVGHLQTNKVRKIIGRFHLIQSVDSVRLAERLSSEGVRNRALTDILLEVNTSGESSKFGLLPDETLDACAKIAELPALRIRGLMTVGPLYGGREAAAAAFATLRKLAESISYARIENVTMEHLSMGMSDDFEIAILEGSTMVRLGRALFGERRG